MTRLESWTLNFYFQMIVLRQSIDSLVYLTHIFGAAIATKAQSRVISPFLSQWCVSTGHESCLCQTGPPSWVNQSFELKYVTSPMIWVDPLQVWLTFPANSSTRVQIRSLVISFYVRHVINRHFISLANGWQSLFRRWVVQSSRFVMFEGDFLFLTVRLILWEECSSVYCSHLLLVVNILHCQVGAFLVWNLQREREIWFEILKSPDRVIFRFVHCSFKVKKAWNVYPQAPSLVRIST